MLYSIGVVDTMRKKSSVIKVARKPATGLTEDMYFCIDLCCS